MQGNQKVTLRFNEDGDSAVVNRLLYNIFPKGVYGRFTYSASPVTGTPVSIQINPAANGTTLMFTNGASAKFNTKIEVYPSADNPIVLPLIDDRHVWLVARYVWKNVRDNYVTFKLAQYENPENLEDSYLEDTDIILGRLVYENNIWTKEIDLSWTPVYDTTKDLPDINRFWTRTTIDSGALEITGGSISVRGKTVVYEDLASVSISNELANDPLGGAIYLDTSKQGTDPERFAQHPQAIIDTPGALNFGNLVRLASLVRRKGTPIGDTHHRNFAIENVFVPHLFERTPSATVAVEELGATVSQQGSQIQNLQTSTAALSSRLDIVEPQAALAERVLSAFELENRLLNPQFRLDFVPSTLRSGAEATFASTWGAHIEKTVGGGSWGKFNLEQESFTDIDNSVAQAITCTCVEAQAPSTDQTVNTIVFSGRANGAQWMTGDFHISCYAKKSLSAPAIQAQAIITRRKPDGAPEGDSIVVSLGEITTSWSRIEGTVQLPAVDNSYGQELGYTEISIQFMMGNAVFAAGGFFNFALPQVVKGSVYNITKKLTDIEEAIRVQESLRLKTIEAQTSIGREVLLRDGNTQAIQAKLKVSDQALTILTGEKSDTLQQSIKIQPGKTQIQGKLYSEQAVTSGVSSGDGFTPMMMSGNGQAVQLPDGTDLDTVWTSGEYGVTNALNAPTDEYVTVSVTAGPDQVKQEVTTQDSPPQKWVRWGALQDEDSWANWDLLSFRPMIAPVSTLRWIRRDHAVNSPGYQSRVVVEAGSCVSFLDGSIAILPSGNIILDNTIPDSTGTFLYVYFYHVSEKVYLSENNHYYKLHAELSLTPPVPSNNIWVKSGDPSKRYSGCYFMYCGYQTTNLCFQTWEGIGDGRVKTYFTQDTTGANFFSYIISGNPSSGFIDFSRCIAKNNLPAWENNLGSIDLLVHYSGQQDGSLMLRPQNDWWPHNGSISPSPNENMPYGQALQSNYEGGYCNFMNIPWCGNPILFWATSGPCSTPGLTFMPVGATFRW